MVTQILNRLDLGDFYSRDATVRNAFVETMGQSLEEIGFFILRTTSLASVVSAAYQAALNFFTLPASTKQRYEKPELRGQGGFTRFGREHAKDSERPDLKEFWQVTRVSLEDSSAPWPEETPAFKPAMVTLYRQLDACASALLEACALYLGQPRTWLSDTVIGGKSILRLAHYPPVPATVPAGSLRAAPHEDINLITLLCEATAPGLEVLTQDGDWLPIQAGADELVVDTGDMLQNLTNGLFKSTTHRVVNSDHSHTRRLSMPFFVHPRPEIDLTPDLDLVKRTGGSPRYPSMTADDYLQQRLQEIGLG